MKKSVLVMALAALLLAAGCNVWWFKKRHAEADAASARFLLTNLSEGMRT